MTSSAEERLPAHSLIEETRDSVSLSLAAWGAIIVVVGYAIQDGVWPAMMAIWGFGMITIGISAYALIWWSRR